jgi:hypothetical protein
MRDITTKVNGVDALDASDFNALNDELENIAESADFTLDPAGGPDTDLNMLGQTSAAYTNAGATYDATGTADAIVLTIGTNLKSCSKYYDNMTVTFKAAGTNTGAATVNISALGVKSIVRPDGSTLLAGDILSGEFFTIVYDLGTDKFLSYRQTQGNFECTSFTSNGIDDNATSNAITITNSENVGMGTVTPQSEGATQQILNISGTTLSSINLTHTDASGAGSDPIGVIDFSRTANESVARIIGTLDGNNDAGLIKFSTQPTGGGLTDSMQISSVGTVRMNQYGDGSMSFTGTNGTVTTSSSIDLKNHESALTDALSKALALNPSYFNWKNKEKYGDRRQLGFYAQEVNQVCDSTGVKTIMDDGSINWGIYDRGLIAIAIGAIQELNEKIKIIEGKLTI